MAHVHAGGRAIYATPNDCYASRRDPWPVVIQCECQGNFAVGGNSERWGRRQKGSPSMTNAPQ